LACSSPNPDAGEERTNFPFVSLQPAAVTLFVVLATVIFPSIRAATAIPRPVLYQQRERPEARRLRPDFADVAVSPKPLTREELRRVLIG